MQTLTIIGAGRVGRTLGRLWHLSKTFEVRQALNRTKASARAAVAFIGAGAAVAAFDALQPSDVYLLTPSDAHIEACCGALADTGLLTPSATVLHCSGSLTASFLSSARRQGARGTSVHPVQSFADPALAAQSFAGTFCGVEGSVGGADDSVAEAFRRIGGVLFSLDPAQKTIYHAGTVFASNYLVALLEIAVRCFERAGLARDLAMRLLEPITRDTLANVFRLGTTQALTGPIARGDQAVVARQQVALSEWDGNVALAYQALGRVALDLAAGQGAADPQDLAVLLQILDGQHMPYSR